MGNYKFVIKKNRMLMRFVIILLVVCGGFSLNAQSLTKAQKKQLKNELKAYKKDLVSFYQEKEANKETFAANDSTIRRLKDEVAVAAGSRADLEQQLQTASKLLAECESKPAPKVDDPSTIPMGTVYKVQIGFYKKYDITSNFDKPKFIGYEDVEGLKRYIISYFSTEEEAEKLKKDIRGLGIKDAFVAKYVDQQRVFEWEKNPKYKNKQTPTSWKDVVPAK
jgi:hypothetical protein